MPTVDQCQKLIDGTNHTLTTINNVNGMKFISKTDTSKYIFIPAAGGWCDTNYYSAGNGGECWSTTYQSADSNANRAFTLCFSFPSPDNLRNGYAFRYYGLSVRAIK